MAAMSRINLAASSLARSTRDTSEVKNAEIHRGPLINKGEIAVFSSSVDILPVGAHGDVLAADSTVPRGIKWKQPFVLQQKGDLHTFDVSDARLPVAPNNYVLYRDNALPLGVAWCPFANSPRPSLNDASDVIIVDVQPNDILKYGSVLTTSHIVFSNSVIYRIGKDDVATVACASPPANARDIILVGSLYYMITGVHTIFTASVVSGPWVAKSSNLTSVIQTHWAQFNGNISSASCFLHDGTKFIVGGRQGTGASMLAYSVDAITWTACQLSGITPAAGNNIMAVSTNGTKYVAVGANFMLTSSDGISWQNNAIVTALFPVVDGAGIAFSGGTWVLAAGAFFTSIDDATTWTRVDVGQSVRSIVYAEDKFTAVSLSGFVFSSVNGLSWLPLMQGQLYTDSNLYQASTLQISYCRGLYAILLRTIQSGSSDADDRILVTQDFEALFFLRRSATINSISLFSANFICPLYHTITNVWTNVPP